MSNPAISVFRPHPKLVKQDKKKHTCWAAALESWMSVTPQSPAHWYIKTQEDAIDEWEMFCNKKGGLDVIWGVQFVAAGTGMDLKVFPDASKLTGRFLADKLKTKGHLYFFFAGGQTDIGNGIGHCVVIYRVANFFSDACTLSIMDPWPDVQGYTENCPLADFKKAKEAVVGWPE